MENWKNSSKGSLGKLEISKSLEKALRDFTLEYFTPELQIKPLFLNLR
jgi:hypothetical protein